MPPVPTWFRGRDDVRRFLAGWPHARPRIWRLRPVRASGQVAFASYRRSDARPVFERHSIELLTLRGDRISEITAFRSSERFAGFGLPSELPRVAAMDPRAGADLPP